MPFHCALTAQLTASTAGDTQSATPLSPRIKKRSNDDSTLPPVSECLVWQSTLTNSSGAETTIECRVKRARGQIHYHCLIYFAEI